MHFIMDKEHSEKILVELATFSQTLLALHKELLGFERKQYESINGSVGSSGNFLGILMNHPSFNWLRKLSGLIVMVDEIIDPSEKNKIEQSPREILLDIEKLLQPDEQGQEFAQKYHTAIHNEPTIAMAHGQAMNELKKIIAMV